MSTRFNACALAALLGTTAINGAANAQQINATFVDFQGKLVIGNFWGWDYVFTAKFPNQYSDPNPNLWMYDKTPWAIGPGFVDDGANAASVGFMTSGLNGIPAGQVQITTVYGLDLDPDADELRMTGVDAMAPEYLLEGVETVYGRFGATFESGPFQAVTLAEIADYLPVQDLSWFENGDPASIVYLSQTMAPLDEFYFPTTCPADCNADDTLNILDFVCFQQQWVQQSDAGDCDANAQLDILDFVCFQQLFTQGCEQSIVLNEDFEDYAVGPVCGQGGWEHWYLNDSGCGVVADEQAWSGDQSLRLDAFTNPKGDDALMPLAGVDSGTWHLRAWTYVPSDATGTAWLVGLNTYDPQGDKNWSLALAVNASDGVLQENPLGQQDPPTLPITYDTWIAIDVFVDLDEDVFDVRYHGEPLLLGKSWSAAMNAPGQPAIEAIHLDAGDMATGISEIYFDDIRLEAVDF